MDYLRTWREISKVLENDVDPQLHGIAMTNYRYFSVISGVFGRKLALSLFRVENVAAVIIGSLWRLQRRLLSVKKWPISG